MLSDGRGEPSELVVERLPEPGHPDGVVLAIADFLAADGADTAIVPGEDVGPERLVIALTRERAEAHAAALRCAR